MPRTHPPLLTLLVVPALAMISETREPAGQLVCPPNGELVLDGAPAEPVALPGVGEGAPASAGQGFRWGQRLVLPLPAHLGRVQVRVRADHDDRYAVEVPDDGRWRAVATIEAAGPAGGMRNRPAIEAVVDGADQVAIRPRAGGSPSSISLACFRGAGWPVPVWLAVAFALGLGLTLLRAIPRQWARDVVERVARADPVLAAIFGASVLVDPFLVVALIPAGLGLRALRARASRRSSAAADEAPSHPGSGP